MFYRFPKTPRLAKLSDKEVRGFWSSHAVFTEKVDGSNVGVHFEQGRIVLQSRGHVLEGGAREAWFERLKPWAFEHFNRLEKTLGSRYLMYGEWCHGKNRIFYDALPSYFIEFAILDKESGAFLSTPRRQELLGRWVSAPILHQGTFQRCPPARSLIGLSRFKSLVWKSNYAKIMASGMSQHYRDDETDPSSNMEGVYVTFEDQDQVLGRMKVVRADFEKIQMDDQKWLRRPIFPNQLKV